MVSMRNYLRPDSLWLLSANVLEVGGEENALRKWLLCLLRQSAMYALL